MVSTREDDDYVQFTNEHAVGALFGTLIAHGGFNVSLDEHDPAKLHVVLDARPPLSFDVTVQVDDG